jgi:hypothetical protein
MGAVIMRKIGAKAILPIEKNHFEGIYTSVAFFIVFGAQYLLRCPVYSICGEQRPMGQQYAFQG